MGSGSKPAFSRAFRLDPEAWNQETYDTLRRLNPALRGADKVNHEEGSFPFSTLRIQAAISITSSKANGDAPVYWDQWALSVIENETRQVISQKNLDELWRPHEDSQGANALEAIADTLKGNASLTLRASGVLLLAARVVNFRFPSKGGQPDGISEQKISTWGAEWERKRTAILDKARAKSERSQQEARAYAKSLLLNSIAEGLKKTEDINPELPQYVISMRFLSALQDLIHQSSGDETDPKNARKIADLQATLMEWRNRFSGNSAREES